MAGSGQGLGGEHSVPANAAASQRFGTKWVQSVASCSPGARQARRITASLVPDVDMGLLQHLFGCWPDQVTTISS